jgi:hypothetical protein
METIEENTEINDNENPEHIPQAIHRARSINWMLVATWIIAFAGIGTAITSLVYYQKQIDEMRKATKLEWRPYLNIEFIEPSESFYYCGSEISADSNKAYALTKFKVTDPIFSSVKHLYYEQYYKVRYKNSGKTPLRIIQHNSGIFTEKEWSGFYQKSERVLLDSILANQKGEFAVDYIITPDTSIDSHKTLKQVINIDYKGIDSTGADHNYIFYIYSFVEYEDYFGTKYNTLLILCLIYEDTIINGYLEFNCKGSIIEKYRWDIGL